MPEEPQQVLCARRLVLTHRLSIADKQDDDESDGMHVGRHSQLQLRDASAERHLRLASDDDDSEMEEGQVDLSNVRDRDRESCDLFHLLLSD